MKTYKQFMAEASDFPGRDEMVKKYGDILVKSLHPRMLVKYLNGKIKKDALAAEKVLAPTRMVPSDRNAHERFNMALMKNPYPDEKRLNIEPMKNGMYRVQLMATANFRSVPYVGSKTWIPYSVFMELVVDSDWNVKKIITQHMTISDTGTIRRGPKFRGTGPLQKVVMSAYDLIAKEAAKDLKDDLKIRMKEFDKYKESPNSWA